MNRLRPAALPVGAGLLLMLSLPPFGWWPLAFGGIALLDRALDGQPALVRFRRTALAFAVVFAPTMFWMQYLTLPGYVLAVAFYAVMFGAVFALLPPSRAGRWLALPGLWVLVEAVRGRWPFGGVPLSTMAQAQVDGILGPTVRLGGPLFLIALTALGGVAVAAATRRSWRAAAIAFAVVVVFVGAAAIAPRGRATGSIEVALVQGGGPTGNRDVQGDEHIVFQRHVDASDDVRPGVDLVLWPEDVVDVVGPVQDTPEGDAVAAIARRLDATVMVGTIEAEGEKFRNAAQVFEPDGSLGDRYEKVRRVPFGEYVPMRSLLELVAGDDLIAGEAIRGSGDGTVDTEVGRLGVVISWEVFFHDRARDAIGGGGEILVNPTNGATFRGTTVQGQQLASSKLRALETGRWVLQIAPTGWSAVVTPGGNLVARTDISEAAVIQQEVGLREGQTIATRIGDWPVVVVAALLVGGGFIASSRGRRVTVG